MQFFKEYNLTDSPLRIDTLVIKKDQGVQIRKKIGRIFRRYNIVEYKGPDDSLSVNTFFNANGYAAILQSGTKREQEIPPDEITITLVGNHYPRKKDCCSPFRFWCRRNWIHRIICGSAA